MSGATLDAALAALVTPNHSACGYSHAGGEPTAWFLRPAEPGTVWVERVRGGYIDGFKRPVLATGVAMVLGWLDAPADLAWSVSVQQPSPAPTQRVYFIRESLGGNIKIGHSKSLGQRLETLRTATPAKLDLLAAIDGGKKRERELHTQFAQSRISGEWFRPTPDLLEFIAGIAS